MQAVELIAGILVAFFTLWDAFETVVLPRTVRRYFGITRRIYLLTWIPWSWALRRLESGRVQGYFLAFYGPLFLILLVFVWALGLILGFGLIQFGLGPEHLTASSTSPGLGKALYFSGSTFFTLGLGDVAPTGTAARAMTVLEAGVGFGFLALVISYLPILYQSFSRREVHISLLDARAGSPPTGIEMIRRNGGLGTRTFLTLSETWAADLLESHLSYPTLAHFRSQHENQSWLAALTMILDTCALIMTGIETIPSEQARFTFAIARHALVDLSQIFASTPTRPFRDRLGPSDLAALEGLLNSIGLVFTDRLAAEKTLADLRLAYEPFASALSQRLLLPLPPWLPSADALDDWQSTPWTELPPIAGQA
jgi:hypothetical protein